MKTLDKIRQSEAIQPIVRELLEETFETQPFGTPVNAVAGTYTITANTIAKINNDDVIVVDGVVFTKKASPTGNFQFSNALTLATNVNKLANYTAVEGSGAVAIAYATKGVLGNDKVITINIIEAVTAGGDGDGTEATATLSAATIALLAVGDTVTFDDVVYEKVTEDATGNEFTTQASLIALMDATDDWGAVDSSGAIVITATADDAGFNDVPILVDLNRVTASGVDGTPAKKSTLMVDATRIYVCIAENTIHDANWLRISADLTTLA